MDLSKIKDVKDLQALIELMGKYELAELEISDAERTVRLSKSTPPPDVFPMAPAFAPLTRADVALPAQTGAAAGAGADDAQEGSRADDLHEVPSPMVGSFYRAPSPEAEPFVREGDRVQSDSVICIIEAMKVMNEIPAPVAGVVREILVKNGESVEYGQALFRIEVE